MVAQNGIVNVGTNSSQFIQNRFSKTLNKNKEGQKLVFNPRMGKTLTFDTSKVDLRKMSATLPAFSRVTITLTMTDNSTRKIHLFNDKSIEVKGRIYISEKGQISVAQNNDKQTYNETFGTHRNLISDTPNKAEIHFKINDKNGFDVLKLDKGFFGELSEKEKQEQAKQEANQNTSQQTGKKSEEITSTDGAKDPPAETIAPQVNNS